MSKSSLDAPAGSRILWARGESMIRTIEATIDEQGNVKFFNL